MNIGIFINSFYNQILTGGLKPYILRIYREFNNTNIIKILKKSYSLFGYLHIRRNKHLWIHYGLRNFIRNLKRQDF